MSRLFLVKKCFAVKLTHIIYFVKFKQFTVFIVLTKPACFLFYFFVVNSFHSKTSVRNMRRFELVCYSLK